MYKSCIVMKARHGVAGVSMVNNSHKASILVHAIAKSSVCRDTGNRYPAPMTKRTRAMVSQEYTND